MQGLALKKNRIRLVKVKIFTKGVDESDEREQRQKRFKTGGRERKTERGSEILSERQRNKKIKFKEKKQCRDKLCISKKKA